MPALRIVRRAIVLASLLAIAAVPRASALDRTAFDDRSFQLIAEFVGRDPPSRPDVRAMLTDGLANGIDVWAPLTAVETDWAARQPSSFMLYCQASSEVLPLVEGIEGLPTGGEVVGFIDAQRDRMRALTRTLGPRAWWDAMPEFDQGGGGWARGRRLDVTSRERACDSWLAYYRGLQPLGAYLAQSPDQRGFHLAAVVDYAADAHYAYRLGVEMAMMERVLDELGDIGTGIAFLRGAARQYDHRWGIDMSEWKTAAGSVTSFDAAGRLVGGFSTGFLERHLYLAYASGAHVVHLEPIEYRLPDGRYNPFGEMVRAFGDFALKRHPELPKPVVRTALMLGRCSGFEPKHGLYDQADAVWYRRIPYAEGDAMTDNLIQLLYPGSSRFGTLPADAPRTAEAYRQALAAGADPRPWEAMAASRLGDQFDVILDDAPPAAWARYATVILAGDVALDAASAEIARRFVAAGGTLVLDLQQAGAADVSLLGATPTGEERVASDAVWVADGAAYAEAAYRYGVVRVAPEAVVVARNAAGDALITRRDLGAGHAYLTTPRYLQAADRSGILRAGQRLIDDLVRPTLPASVSGQPSVEYVIGAGVGATTVTVANGTATGWDGTIAFDDPAAAWTCAEWTADVPVAAVAGHGVVDAAVHVPAWGVRVFALTWAPSPSPTAH